MSGGTHAVALKLFNLAWERFGEEQNRGRGQTWCRDVLEAFETALAQAGTTPKRRVRNSAKLLDAAVHLFETGHRDGSVIASGCGSCRAARAAISKARGDGA